MPTFLKIVASVVGFALLLTLGYFAVSKAWTWRDDSRARTVTAGPYEGTLESLNRHPLPDWFADAKFGVMIHWGPYSVPGYAPKGKTFEQLLVSDYGNAMTRNPYAEDYANAMKDPSSPTAAFHGEHYNGLSYNDFATRFGEGWDPEAWAETFKRAGASYVVLTAKYADGYSLWPTEIRNPHAPDFHSKRDLVGELAAASRKRGMKFGVYYSGGVDWTFQPTVVKTLGDYAYLPYGEDYRSYAEAQVRELITRYHPDILWNDIAWPTGQKRLYALLADYYNTVPEGVVNDRWQTATFGRQVMGLKPMRWGFDQVMKRALAQPGVAEQVSTPAVVPHSDFRTPEYTGFDTIQSKFWQQDRGIGGSFGFNRTETDADYAPVPELLSDLVTAAANNGSFLLNVGPSGAEGAIVAEQMSRLRGIGEWMGANREALDGTRPYPGLSAKNVALTRKGDTVYAIVLGASGSLTVQGVTQASILDTGDPVPVSESTVALEGLPFGTVIKLH